MDKVNYFVGYNFSSVFDVMFSHIQKEKKTRRVGPRGKQTIEFAGPTSWTLYRPWNCWQTLPGRKLNPFFAAAEIFWILGGNSDVDWICRFNENMRTFADEGESHFNAAYGTRIRRYPFADMGVDQVLSVVNRLKEDRDTRRACIGLWHPIFDNRKSKDIACNNMVYFLIRDNLLHTTVTIRSNDLVWGTPYNMLQFQHLALLVQGEYNKNRTIKNRIGRGHHTVQANSLHLYLNAYDKYDELVGRLKLSGSIEINQNQCQDPICFQEFDHIYNRLDRDLRSLESGGGEFNFGLISLNTYWEQLAAMAVVYLARKHYDVTKYDVLRWAKRSLHPVFSWLIADFWGLKD